MSGCKTPCPSWGHYRWLQRHGQPPCPACLEWLAARQKQVRDRNRAEYGRTEPWRVGWSMLWPQVRELDP